MLLETLNSGLRMAHPGGVLAPFTLGADIPLLLLQKATFLKIAAINIFCILVHYLIIFQKYADVGKFILFR